MSSIVAPPPAAAVQRVFNFSAGPSMLPMAVLEQIQQDLFSYDGYGSSVLELSHRCQTFIDIHEDALARFRRVLRVPDSHAVIFMQGGGRLQNVLIPMNLITDPSQTADYIVSGQWGSYSAEEVPHFGRLNLAWDGGGEGFRRLPAPGEVRLTAGAAYFHYTSNETIHGVQFHELPDSGGAPLVCDASSDILSRPLDVSRFGMVYACAQKNAGVAGLTIAAIRRDLLDRGRGRVPGYLNFASHVENDSMFNTPPTFAIYVTGLVCKWLEEDIGGLEAMERINREKAATLYEVIDRYPGFYFPHSERSCRSIMNVVFRTASADLDDRFCTGARQHQLSDVRGHKVLGGMRASIYNAMPLDGVRELARYMDDFARRNG